MKMKCNYCGSMIDDTASFCPNCGAPNQNMKRTTEHTPKTIEELQQWYAARHLPPPETTRFFIGVDYKEPRAFGIYKNGNHCVVYKNKDDGSRAIRYEGDDEAYAVNEIYLKLKSEILNQKARNQQKGGSGRGGSRKGSGSSSCGGTVLKWFGIVIIAFVFVAAVYYNPLPALIAAGAPVGLYFLLCYLFKKKGKEAVDHRKYGIIYLVFLLVVSLVIIGISPAKSKARYYSYNDTVYARYGSEMYVFDPVLYDYEPIDWYYVPDDLAAKPEDYEFDAGNVEWDNSYMFEDSNYYEETIEPEEHSTNNSNYNYGNSWDNDSDWSNDSDWDWDSGDSDWDWDSGGSDWDSDW